ncbi:hypothetical protein [Acinetobacter sp. AG3]|jgi:hypothetical protein|uniref:hypothetical protein n=1 Tax=unclassified Acinetobacter TaxID=196816 RepID=UPI001EF0C280|nr:hypothetical protein [Acinetobacter sp. AG3]MCG7218940.1 hypothetical protein [Acinetobacter sp. AG3]
MLKLSNSFKKVILLFGFILFLSSSVTANTNTKKDTFLVDKDIIIYAPLSDRKINALKKKLGDSFYDVADDSNFYIANADEFLSNKKIKNVTLSSQVKMINFSKKYFIKVDKIPAWSYVFYKKGSPPIFVNAIDVEEKYNSFYK